MALQQDYHTLFSGIHLTETPRPSTFNQNQWHGYGKTAPYTQDKPPRAGTNSAWSDPLSLSSQVARLASSPHQFEAGPLVILYPVDAKKLYRVSRSQSMVSTIAMFKWQPDLVVTCEIQVHPRPFKQWLQLCILLWYQCQTLGLPEVANIFQLQPRTVKAQLRHVNQLVKVTHQFGMLELGQLMVRYPRAPPFSPAPFPHLLLVGGGSNLFSRPLRFPLDFILFLKYPLISVTGCRIGGRKTSARD